MRKSHVKDADEAPDWLDDEGPQRVQKPLTRGKKFALDFVMLLFIPFTFWAGWFELQRAVEGRWQAWVYSFEWPLFGFVGIWFWRRVRSGNPINWPKLEPPRFDDEN